MPNGGYGLFADQFIPQGTKVWEFDKQFDIIFTKEEVEGMSELKKKYIHLTAYFSIPLDLWICSLDNTRFTNHSDNPNMMIDPRSLSWGGGDGYSIAIRDIQLGEELFDNYKEVYPSSVLQKHHKEII